MSKFKIGDEIHYMESNKPQSKKVTGIASLEGEVRTSGLDVKLKDGEKKVLYFTSSYSYVEENDTYKTFEELKESVFSTLPKK